MCKSIVLLYIMVYGFIHPVVVILLYFKSFSSNVSTVFARLSSDENLAKMAEMFEEKRMASK